MQNCEENLCTQYFLWIYTSNGFIIVPSCDTILSLNVWFSRWILTSTTLETNAPRNFILNNKQLFNPFWPIIVNSYRLFLKINIFFFSYIINYHRRIHNTNLVRKDNEGLLLLLKNAHHSHVWLQYSLTGSNYNSLHPLYKLF